MALSKRKIFVSTGAFLERDLSTTLEICRHKQIGGIELSSQVSFSKDVRLIIDEYRKENRIDLLLHNYFPLPRTPFVLNLASNDRDILQKSREHCLGAIGLCAHLSIPQYSVHCGFCFHAGPEDLGGKQLGLPRIPFETAEAIFVESLIMLAEEAERLGLGIAIENNVVIASNVVRSRNELLLGVTSDDLLSLLEKAGRKNVSILLDLAHLIISSNSLGFSPSLYVKDISPHVRIIHLSDNDGVSDTNQPLSEESWFWPDLFNFLSDCEAYVLELKNLSVDRIVSQFNFFADKIKDTGVE